MLYYSGDKASVSQIIHDGIAFLRENKLTHIKEISNADGTVTVKAKAVDRFQFVLRPEVTVDPKQRRIVSCICDCKNGRIGLCPHSVALLLTLGEEVVPQSIEPAPASAAPAPAPEKEEITLRFIHENAAAQTEGYRPLQPSFVAPQPINAVFVVPEAAAGFNRSAAVPAQAPTPENAQTPLQEPESVSETGAENTAEPEAPAAENAPEAPEQDLFAEPGISVRIGSREKDGTPVEWTPNDTEKMLHPNMGIIGTMGTGKTQFTKSLICQVTRQQALNYGSNNVGILIFDYKGDYNETKCDFIEATGAKVLKPYHLPYNPLAIVQPVNSKPLLPIHTANAFKDTLAKIYRLGPKQQQFLLDCINKAYEEKGIKSDDPGTWNRHPPTFSNVYNIYMEEVGNRAPDSLAACMNKLQKFCIFEDSPLFGGTLLDLMKGVVVIDMSGYDPDIQNLVVAITLEQFHSQMLSMGSSRTNGRYRELRELILVDEADYFMQADFPALRKILKEGREFGVGVVLSTQSLTHFVSGRDDYSRYILTWVVHSTSDLKQKDVEYIFKLPPKSTKIEKTYGWIKGLVKHQSVVKIANDAPEIVNDLPFWKLISEQS